MKSTLVFFIFFALTLSINAQETKTIDSKNNHKNFVSENTNNNTSPSTILTPLTDDLIEDNICYAEISKVTFFKALIKQNGFDITIQEGDDNNTDIALKSTEEIITSNKERISYSE
ncbi:hypothetical protein [Aquimarina mytili]|uniref:Uncharacterized protein n=1 Tax=Aquimarina mytili TaxID=874423 RepID=A0A936ZSS1_9FLAO|nr:hypothetical protein [Aquimarina mytili]MBL0683632.1 hypothetical protein [Aquimarina mytili]